MSNTTDSKLPAIRWPGGKTIAPGTTSSTGRWLHKHLPPPERHKGYAEPFSGMLGTLLSRRRAEIEKVNDLDGHITNWWKVVRDRREELIDMFLWSPSWDETIFNEALADLDNPDPVRAAYNFTISREWSHMGMGLRPGRYFTPETKTGSYITRKLPDRITNLYERIKLVHIHNEDAVKFLRRLSKYDYTIYCDPPYADLSSDLYTHTEYDMGALTEALHAQTGFVAISEYGDVFDHLGWERFEINTISGMAVTNPLDRVEVVWVNKPDEMRNRQGVLI